MAFVLLCSGLAIAEWSEELPVRQDLAKEIDSLVENGIDLESSDHHRHFWGNSYVPMTITKAHLARYAGLSLKEFEKATELTEKELRDHVEWRMGGAYKPKACFNPLPTEDFVASNQSVFTETSGLVTALALDDEENFVFRLTELRSNRAERRVEIFLKQLRELEIPKSTESAKSITMHVDFEDSRLQLPVSTNQPRFGYNRLAVSTEMKTPEILWGVGTVPMQEAQTALFSRSTLKKWKKVSFKEQKNVLIWRGSVHGSSFPLNEDGTRSPYCTIVKDAFPSSDANKCLRFDVFTQKLAQKGSVSKEDMKLFETFERYYAVNKLGNMTSLLNGRVQVDVAFRFKPGDLSRAEPIFRDLNLRIGGEVPMNEFQKFKFHLALAGNDIASSMPFDMVSNSVLLMPKPVYHTQFNYKLEDMKHYIEIKPDLSNLEEKLGWCLDNEAECEKIAKAGFVHLYKYFGTHDKQKRVRELILKTYIENQC
eukprot:CAMPEP_0184478166 /NCGR_PEP_ID=MMETSP0113_2-20130426/264_1 /TAXON_ID=91329 /ORGANISM="Norrisiella sphaerica, Strain BC52" /LENGTH=481 /DNA_ID=CAMNT_0026855855 /DNA_START=40 /DNA_END=1485 /DNA_ORIENTATION=-